MPFITGAARSRSSRRDYSTNAAVSGGKPDPALTPPSGTMQEYSTLPAGSRLAFPVTGSVAGAAFGDNPYSIDSSLAAAAVHAGVLAAGSTDIIAVEVQNGLPEYAGTTRYGVSTAYRGSSQAAYRVLAGASVASTTAGLAIGLRTTLRVQGRLTRSDVLVGDIFAGLANAASPPTFLYATLGRIRWLEINVRGGQVLASFVPSLSYMDASTAGAWVAIPQTRSVFVDAQLSANGPYSNVAATASFLGTAVAGSTANNAGYLVQETYNLPPTAVIRQPVEGVLWPLHPQTNANPLSASPGAVNVTRQYRLTLPQQLGGASFYWGMKA